MQNEEFVLSFSLLPRPPSAPNPTRFARSTYYPSSTIQNPVPPSIPPLNTAIPSSQAPCFLRDTHFLDLDDDICGLIHAKLEPDKMAATALRSTCQALHRSPAVTAHICSLTLKVPYTVRVRKDVRLPNSEMTFHNGPHVFSETESSDSEGPEASDESGPDESGSDESEPDGSESSDLDGPHEWTEYFDVSKAARSWVTKIVRFPQHASIVSLLIVEQDHEFSEAYLEELLRRISWSTAACARLATVTHVELKGGWLTQGIASTLLNLIPSLKGHGTLALSRTCAYGNAYKDALNSAHNLPPGYDHYEYNMEDEGKLPGMPFYLGMLTQLRSLSLVDMDYWYPIDLGWLKGLQHLRFLSIASCKITNLDILLQHVPIYELSINNLRSFSKVCIASSTLCVLKLHRHDISNFKLCLEELPSIQCVSFSSITFNKKSDDFHDECLAALALSRFPLRLPAVFELALDPALSPEQQTAAFLALLPLKPALSQYVHELHLERCSFHHSSIQALGSLFGTVCNLHLSYRDVCSTHRVLLEILQGIPSVSRIRVAMCSAERVPDIQWCVEVIRSAHQARRGFILRFGREIRPIQTQFTWGVSEPMQACLDAVRKALRDLSGPPIVLLDVDWHGMA